MPVPLLLRVAQLWQDFQQFRISIARLGDILHAPRKAISRLHAILNTPDTAVGCYVGKGDRMVAVMDIAIGEPFLAEGGDYANCHSIYITADIRKTLLDGRIAAILVDQAKTWA